MLSNALRVGLRVQVGDGAHYRQGMLGTVTQVYGDPSSRAAEVMLDDGRTVLYWYSQIEPAEVRISTPHDLSQAVMTRQ